ncbi:MAG: type II toxin-antitoxin system HicA family toxin [Gemmataceae bacterium]|nr:type II toxin-antitoxin system HicA family toxin [Gemmataceae bacterium]
MKALSGKDLCKLLEKHGWGLDHVSGSHHVYTHPDNPAILSVPVHAGKTLKKGLQHGILKTAGLLPARKRKKK